MSSAITVAFCYEVSICADCPKLTVRRCFEAGFLGGDFFHLFQETCPGPLGLQRPTPNFSTTPPRSQKGHLSGPGHQLFAEATYEETKTLHTSVCPPPRKHFLSSGMPRGHDCTQGKHTARLLKGGTQLREELRLFERMEQGKNQDFCEAGRAQSTLRAALSQQLAIDCNLLVSSTSLIHSTNT